MLLSLIVAFGATTAAFGADGVITSPGCGQRPLAREDPDDHGARQARLVGGQEASPHAWPFVCNLQWMGHPLCGGSLVKSLNGEYYFLTAAHCIISTAEFYTVRCASHDLGQHEAHEQDLKVDRIVAHPDFDPNTVDIDLAVMHLASQPLENNYLQPVCLADEAYNAGEMATVLGWGALFPDGATPSTLHQARTPLMDRAECNELYNGEITSTMLCAGYPGVGGAGPCQGDSGGPLVAERNGSWTLIGVVSWPGCGKPQQPGVYADVHHFRSWINSVINA